MKYYKFLKADRIAPYSGYQYPEPGEWTPEVTDLVECKSGYHLCRLGTDMLEWFGYEELWEVEPGDRIEEYDNKVNTNRCRLIRRIETWNKKTAHLFTDDCAEHVLHLFENGYPDNCWQRKEIQAARDYAHRKIDHIELTSARTIWAAWADWAAWATWAARATWDARADERMWQAEKLIEMLGLEES